MHHSRWRDRLPGNFICVGGRHAPRERLLFWNEGCWVLWCWLGLICGCCTVWPLPCELRCIFVICVLNVEQKMYVANRGNEWKYVNLTAAYFRYQVISPLRLPPQRWVINSRLWYKTEVDRLICVFAGSFINAILSPRILSRRVCLLMLRAILHCFLRALYVYRENWCS